MSKKIFIVESDAGFSKKLRGEFEGKGFSVAESGDGKTALDTAKKEKPDLVVLAVELAAGQSGYIVCGKLKKDDDLKKTPVIIIGKDAEGFESHKKLKTRAEEYLKKPVDPSVVLDKVGGLIGFPEEDISGDLVVEDDESLGLGSLGEEDEPLTQVETKAAPSETREDPDLDLLDDAFESISDDKDGAAEQATTVAKLSDLKAAAKDEGEVALDALGEEPVEAPPEEGLLEETDPSVKSLSAGGDDDSALDALGSLEDEKPVEDDVALDALEPVEEAPPPPKPVTKPAAVAKMSKPAPAPAAPAVDTAELNALREKAEELEAKVRELELEVQSKANELDAVKSTTGGKDKEFFALKEQNTKKDKEILRLKQDLNEKEQEVVELREKENTLEQKASETTQEIAKRDATIKTLTQKADAALADKKKVDGALAQAKDEIRNLSAKLATAQGELDQAQDAVNEKAQEAEAARGEADAKQQALEALKGEFENLKREADEAKSAVDDAKREAESARSELESLKSELESAKAELTSKQSAWEEESQGLRARVAELEDATSKNEERVVKAYQKIKVEEKLKEKTKKALAIAMQLLEENGSGGGKADESSEEEALS